MKTKRFVTSVFIATLCLVSVGCAGQKVSFNAAAPLSSVSTPEPLTISPITEDPKPPVPAEDLVCRAEPNAGPITNGLRVDVYHSKSGGGDTSVDYIRYGTRVNRSYRFEEIFIPTRTADSGLVTRNGIAIRDDNDTLLQTHFALDFHAGLALGSQDEAGYYQFAIVSDDGATLHYLNSAGQDVAVVSAEGVHGTTMTCSKKAVRMKRGAAFPIRLTYFQGPAVELAVMLIWRKVDQPAANGAQELPCDGSSSFFSSDRTTIAPDLQARGWKLVQPTNFVYSGGSEICVLK